MKIHYAPTCSFLILSLVLFPGAFCHAQGLTAPLGANGISGGSEPVPARSTWIENEQERTLYSSSYRTPDGHFIMRTGKRPINYYKNGRLEPIDFSLKPSPGGWSAEDQPNPTYLSYEGNTFLTLAPGKRFEFNRGTEINGQPVSVKVSPEGNHVLARDVVPGIDKEYLFYENAIKYNYIIRQPVSVPDPYFRITDKIVFPDGYQFIRTNENGEQIGGLWSEGGSWKGDLTLLDPEGHEVSRFHAPVCFDGDKQFTIGSYNLSMVNGERILEIRVPMSWINDPSRIFPVVIDPLVIGPTTTWTGGPMPSCIAPVHNADSILVTIPAAVSITGLYVTSSFYADPFTTAVMSQGTMYFSTSCNNSVNFTVPNPQGNTPGTAYLDSFDLRNPLMCCFFSACTTRTFYLTMHLARTGPSTGCNTTYIRYDPFSTLWPFSALVVGRTVEAFGNQWAVPNTPICSNTCSVTGTVYIRYGVPPFTISHPWLQTPITAGTLNSCGSGAVVQQVTLTIPNCPVYCDTVTQLVVPPPLITDACGNTVSNMPSRIVPVKQAPDIDAIPNPLTVCSGDAFSIALSSCNNGAVLNWFGNSNSGTGNIADALSNFSTSSNTVNYSAYATFNGCSSDTLLVPVTVDPLPLADFSYLPDPCLMNVPVQFTDISSIYAGNSNAWSWDFGDNTSAVVQDPSHAFAVPGTYNVCMVVTTTNGCEDTVCKTIEVISPDVLLPNVITPNGDAVNDFLEFGYLEFFPGNTLELYNRWGALIFSKSAYVNDWSPADISQGTYYFVLNVKDLNKVYTGFIEVLR